MSEKRTIVVFLVLTVVAILGTAVLVVAGGGEKKHDAPAPVAARLGGPVIRPLGSPPPPPPDGPPPEMMPPPVPPPAAAIVQMPPPSEPPMDLPADPKFRAEAIEKRIDSIDHDLERVRTQMEGAGAESREEVRKELIQLLRQRTSIAREARVQGIPVRPAIPPELKGFHPRHDIIDPAAPPNR